MLIQSHTVKSTPFYKDFLVFIFFCYTLSTCWNLGNISKTLLTCILIAILIPIYRNINQASICALLFSITYAVFGSLNGYIGSISTILFYVVPPFFFYLYGKYLSIQIVDDNKLIDFYIITSYCFCLSVFYSVLDNIFVNGNLICLNRQLLVGNTEDINFNSATLIGLNVAIGFASLPIALFCKINMTRRLLCLSLFLLSLLTTIHLVNRTGLIVIIFSFTMVSYFYYKRHSPIKFAAYFILIFAVVVILTPSLINSDLFEAYNERNSDLSSGGGRFTQWIDGALKLITMPLGYQLSGNSLSYVHNLWLDIARVGGIIPFILVIIITYGTPTILPQLIDTQHNIAA